jgi:hypothetical protein
MTALYERTPRRMRCAQQIHALGPRMLLELAWHLAHGAPLDPTLERFAELSPDDCVAAGCSDLPVGRPRIVRGCH